MCEYGFNENIDYRAISQKRLTVQGNYTTYTDHEISIDMAKELAMIQRMCEYGFNEGTDYREIMDKIVQNPLE